MSALSHYEVLEHLGSGSFGKVYNCRKMDRKVLVWKEIDYGEVSPHTRARVLSSVL